MRQHPVLKSMKVGHPAAECSLCPNGVEWAPGTVRASSNHTYKYCIEKGVKFLALGETWASKNAHARL